VHDLVVYTAEPGSASEDRLKLLEPPRVPAMAKALTAGREPLLDLLSHR